MSNTKKTIIIGAGAAGVFAANHLQAGSFLILEKGSQPLCKVKISGGGRCNVTHHCFDVKTLTSNYPRGHKELIGPFHSFQPKDTFTWFEKRGVPLKSEEDGRVFPVSDSSQSIIDCLLREVQPSLKLKQGVQSIEKKGEVFHLHLNSKQSYRASTILLASGSSSQGHRLAQSLGHSIEKPLPSLFTFNVPDSPFLDLAGVAVKEAKVSLPKYSLSFTGPLLITHWGFSGPAVLKLSAWGAKVLNSCGYQCMARIDLLPKLKEESLRLKLEQLKSQKSLVKHCCPFEGIPKRLWTRILELLQLEACTGLELSKKQVHALCEKLKYFSFQIKGKTGYKQEFVTCGGVKLSEINFKSMESKVCPGLFFAGEVLDIDGITGGFNFQSAWSTAYLAATAINKFL